MKVILTERVYKHGVAGDVVNVADGFARNYLIPRGLAIKATPYALERNQQLIAEAESRRDELQQLLDEVSQQIHGVELVFGVKAGKNNKLYGSVTTRDIAEGLLEKTGVDIDRRRISEKPLRELGIHEVPVRMSATVSPVLRIVILREEEVEDYLEGKPVASLSAGPEAEVEAGEDVPEEEAADEAGEADEVVATDVAGDDVAADAAPMAEADAADEPASPTTVAE
ncbi:MAG: 50S ribosomal protein L9 [Chloroflexi bacterium]|nr:50S ribosomal protein L9 [Chloroflexota bacterium]